MRSGHLKVHATSLSLSCSCCHHVCASFPFALCHYCKFPAASWARRQIAASSLSLQNYKAIKPLFSINYPVWGMSLPMQEWTIMLDNGLPIVFIFPRNQVFILLIFCIFSSLYLGDICLIFILFPSSNVEFSLF